MPFYTSMESFIHKWDKYARKDACPLTSKRDILAWQEKARNTLSTLLFPHPEMLSSCSPDPEFLDSTDLGKGLKREHLTIRVEEDVRMSLYLFVPAGAGKHTPVYICPPGHDGGGKESVAGHREDPEITERIDHYHSDYALSLARAGFVTIAFDCRGMGERREREVQSRTHILEGSCYGIAHMAEPLGMTLLGLLVWDIERLIDYVESRSEWGEIRMLGFSGGGLQVLYVAAMDKRVKEAFVSGWFYGFKDSLLFLHTNCSCNYVPNLWLHFDVQDIGALIAPRPLVIQSARGDHLNGPRGMANVDEPYHDLETVYRMLGEEQHLQHSILEGEHHFGLEDMLPFISLAGKETMETICKH